MPILLCSGLIHCLNYSHGRQSRLFVTLIALHLFFISVHSRQVISVDFHTEQFQELFNVDDEPSNLCTGDLTNQLSCNRASNVRINTHGQLELLASINSKAGNSMFMFDGAKIFTKRSWISGSASIIAKQPIGRYLRSSFGLRTYSSNGVDWSKHHRTCLVYTQQIDSLLFKIYDRINSSSSTQLWSKKIINYKDVQQQFYNYTIQWNKQGIQWLINNRTVAKHRFMNQSQTHKWHLFIQQGVAGNEYTELRYKLPEANQNWSNPVLLIDSLQIPLTSNTKSMKNDFIIFLYSIIVIFYLKI